MRQKWRIVAIAALTAMTVMLLGSSQSMAQPRAHVYLLRGLMNIFSLGMDDLCDKIKHRGIYATVHGYSDWQSLADQAAAGYRAGTEGPIILIGHSLGADAVMEMADYLDTKGIPVALVVPFDGTKSFTTPKNVGRLVNLTQRDYAYMTRGPGFHGSLVNVDVSSDPNIGHISIDKSPRLHARAISEILGVIGSGHRIAAPSGAKPTAVNHHAPSADDSGAKAPAAGVTAKPEGSSEPPVKPGSGAMNAMDVRPVADSQTPMITLPEEPSRHPGTSPRKPAPSDSASAVPN